MLRPWLRAKATPGKDAGSVHIRDVDATEDAAWRQLADASKGGDIA
jgi:hypothetical protein